MLSPWHSSRTHPFDHHEFYKDFTSALHQLERDRPFVEEHRRWWMALAEADQKDTARWVAAQNSASDADYYARQHATIAPWLGELSTRELVKVNGRVGTVDRLWKVRDVDARGQHRSVRLATG